MWVTGFSYKTFVPSATKVGMCSGSPEYESIDETWDRARAWLRLVGKKHITSQSTFNLTFSCCCCVADRRVVGVETFYHTLNKVWHEQDSGESTVMNGEWSQRDRRDVPRKSRLDLVQVIRYAPPSCDDTLHIISRKSSLYTSSYFMDRIFLDGDYHEPPLHLLPPTPQVQEVNDCKCVIL